MTSIRSCNRFVGVLLLALVLAACETAPPVQEMSDARQAITVAREAGAADLAAAELAEAEQYLQNAEAKLDHHQYREARHAALEAKYRAQRALQLSEASKDSDGG
jgi:outer membrane PBP1 activator LpoA protein